MADSLGLEAAVSGTWMMMFIYIYSWMSGCMDRQVDDQMVELMDEGWNGWMYRWMHVFEINIDNDNKDNYDLTLK